MTPSPLPLNACAGWILSLCALLLWCEPAKTAAQANLPALFSEHMVLHQGKTVPVWGRAGPGEQVTVTIAGQTITTRASDTGRWRVDLAPLPSGGPYTLHVKAKNELAVADVLGGGFSMAGEHQHWQPAEARSAGDAVIVSNPAIKNPAAVRYAWQNNPDGNLFNGAGLPASPFRTADWQ